MIQRAVNMGKVAAVYSIWQALISAVGNRKISVQEFSLIMGKRICLSHYHPYWEIKGFI